MFCAFCFIVILEIKHKMKCNFIPTDQGRKLEGSFQGDRLLLEDMRNVLSWKP